MAVEDDLSSRLFVDIIIFKDIKEGARQVR